MKNFYWISFAFIFLYSCNSTDSAENKFASFDSTHFIPANSGKLDKNEQDKYAQLVTNFLDSAINEKYFNGAVLVAKNGVIVYENYFGYKDIRTKDTLTKETPLQIASTSKTFTGIAILRLIQEGKLKLDDNVNKFFAGFPYADVTVKTLLNHRSGLPEYLYYFEKNNWDRKLLASNDDVINSLIKWQPARASLPNKRFDYCNTNFVLLASIIEKVSGMSYPDYMKTNFFEPLRMHNTYVKTISDSLSNVSFDGYGKMWDNDFSDGPYGDKNIYSTPRDLLKWDQALYTGNVISQQLLDSAYTPYSNERKTMHNYGLGWRLLVFPNGKKAVYHNGRWHGFNSAFARLTDENATIIILTNKYNRSIYTLARKMYNLFGPYDANSNEVVE